MVFVTCSAVLGQFYQPIIMVFVLGIFVISAMDEVQGEV